MLKAARALLSVYDKRGLPELAQGLVGLGVELLSTGGTYRELEAAGIPVLPVSEVTGFPEILGGRVTPFPARINDTFKFFRGEVFVITVVETHHRCGTSREVACSIPPWPSGATATWSYASSRRRPVVSSTAGRLPWQKKKI